MCGRFTITHARPDEVERRFGAAGVSPDLVGRDNVAPSEPIAVIAAGAAGRTAAAARWGLLPAWARSLRERVAPINARSEAVAERAMFRDLVATPAGRVLVPADGWYEWLRAEDRRHRPQPFRFAVDGGGLFAIAGLARRVVVGGEAVLTACLLTTAANPVCATIHDRMPAVLADPAAEEEWLTAPLDADDVAALCRPLAAGRVRAEPADPALNRAGHAGDDGQLALL